MSSNNEKEKFTLNSLEGYKSAFELVKNFSIIVSVTSIIATAGVAIYFSSKLDQLMQGAYVIDASQGGLVGVAKFRERHNPSTRIFEYEDHVRGFYENWYSFDENTYEANLNKALPLIGEVRKSLLASYKEEGLQQKIKQNSLIFEVTIQKLDIDPVQKQGKIYGIQTIKRESSYYQRRLDCEFTLTDIQRSSKNPHGVLIEKWIIFNNKDVDQTNAEPPVEVTSSTPAQ